MGKRGRKLKDYTLEFPNILGELGKLQTNPYYTLQQVGDACGLTRERIRQIIPRLLGVSYTKLMRSKIGIRQQDMKNWGCQYDPRRRENNNVASPVAKGTSVEVEVMNICKELGIDCKPYQGYDIDLMIEGKPVEVKMSGIPSKTGKYGRAYYRFNVSRSQIKKCAFIICKAGECYYIIPNGVVNNGTSLYIPAECSKTQRKYKRGTPYTETTLKYLEAWELLLKC